MQHHPYHSTSCVEVIMDAITFSKSETLIQIIDESANYDANDVADSQCIVSYKLRVINKGEYSWHSSKSLTFPFNQYLIEVRCPLIAVRQWTNMTQEVGTCVFGHCVGCVVKLGMLKVVLCTLCDSTLTKVYNVGVVAKWDVTNITTTYLHITNLKTGVKLFPTGNVENFYLVLCCSSPLLLKHSHDVKAEQPGTRNVFCDGSNEFGALYKELQIFHRTNYTSLSTANIRSYREFVGISTYPWVNSYFYLPTTVWIHRLRVKEVRYKECDCTCCKNLSLLYYFLYRRNCLSKSYKFAARPI